MEIILVQDVASVGKAGQRATVKDGYARNFLIPRGLASALTPGAGSAAQARHAAQLRSAEMAKDKAQELAGHLAGIVCRIPVSVGQQGKLHGSVTASDIVEALKNQGISIEKHQVHLERPLTQAGDYSVPVRLHPEVKAEVRVILAKD